MHLRRFACRLWWPGSLLVFVSGQLTGRPPMGQHDSAHSCMHWFALLHDPKILISTLVIAVSCWAEENSPVPDKSCEAVDLDGDNGCIRSSGHAWMVEADSGAWAAWTIERCCCCSAPRLTDGRGGLGASSGLEMDWRPCGPCRAAASACGAVTPGSCGGECSCLRSSSRLSRSATRTHAEELAEPGSDFCVAWQNMLVTSQEG